MDNAIKCYDSFCVERILSFSGQLAEIKGTAEYQLRQKKIILHILSLHAVLEERISFASDEVLRVEMMHIMFARMNEYKDLMLRPLLEGAVL